MVDFASEGSYESASKRLYEHHSVEVHPTTIRRKAMSIASTAVELVRDVSSVGEEVSSLTNQCERVILEMDGVMVPIVSTDGEAPDRRKNRAVGWKELKVGAVEDPTLTTRRYAASFQDSDDLGDQLTQRLKELRPSEEVFVHGVGDGATWIPEQGERVAGTNYHHLIDFYHLSEYLHAAFEGDPRAGLKTSRSKQEMKAGKMSKVIRRLQRQLAKSPDHVGVSACLRYLRNRPGQFNYLSALENELPIGSGMIESTNRSLIQFRLKRPGAWWLPDSVVKMASLRVLRANGGWDSLWRRAA